MPFTSLMPSPRQRFYTNTGTPAAFHKLYTYGAGTTANKAAYQDAAGTVPHENPITLDAKGEALIYFSGNYKVDLKDPLGTQVTGYPVDNFNTDPNGVALIYPTLAEPDGSAGIGFQQAGVGVRPRSAEEVLRERDSVSNYEALSSAIAAGGTLLVPKGVHNITADLDFGQCALEFSNGGSFNVSNGVKVIIRKQVTAGDFQIFSTTGNVIVAGEVNPMWWGAVRSTASPGPVVAAKNTLAFRKAMKSFYAEYIQINGTRATPSGPQLAWEVVIPPGLFYFSNGFSAPVGVRVRGAGAATCLCRLTENYDSDTAIPLLTVGQSLGPAPTLAYQNDAVQSSSVFTSAGFTQTAGQASGLYFVDQQPSVAAFKPAYPGLQFSDLFFTSCGISMDLRNAADTTGSNLVIDMGLSGILFGESQNVALTNVILYNQKASAITFASNARDITINNFIIEYPEALGIYFSEGETNNKNIRFSDGVFTANVQYAGFGGMIRNRASNVDVSFSSVSFRNVKGPTILNDLVTSGCSFAFDNCTWDGNRTTDGYNQGATMSVGSVYSGTYSFKSCIFKNLYNAFATSYGPVNVVVEGLTYSGMNYSGSIFNFDGTGSADFLSVRGDAVTPLLSVANCTYQCRVKGSLDWLGAPVNAGGYLTWKVHAPHGQQYFATITARVSSGYAAGSRKSKTYIVEKSIEYNFGPGMDTLTSATILGSPTLGGVPEAALEFKFSDGTTSTATSYPNTTYFNMRVPDIYVDVRVNIDFLA